jgi:putative spermidine/putrescine transport system ATP-binding protein
MARLQGRDGPGDAVLGQVVLQVADPATIYAAPSNHFVARFLGECSILRVTATDGGCGYEIGGVRQPLPSPATAPFDIVVRPENVSVHPVLEAVSDDVSGVPATIRDITYLGAGWRVTLQLPDGQLLLASIVRGDRMAGHLAPGESVVARWAPAFVAVLPAEKSS